MLALARAVLPLAGRNSRAGGDAIAAIRIKGPIMMVMITIGARHGYHHIRDCSEMEQFASRRSNRNEAGDGHCQHIPALLEAAPYPRQRPTPDRCLFKSAVVAELVDAQR